MKPNATDTIGLHTPQMTCPTCRATVRITAKGTITQHTRSVGVVVLTRHRWRHTSTDKRCPSSFAAAPDGAHATWLRDRYAASAKCAEECRATAHRLRVEAEAHDAEALVHANRAAAASAALASVGVVLQEKRGNSIDHPDDREVRETPAAATTGGNNR